jgi:hypothetical protein
MRSMEGKRRRIVLRAKKIIKKKRVEKQKEKNKK